MKHYLLGCTLLALLLAPVAMRAVAKDEPTDPAAALGMKSVAVVSIASYDDIKKNITFLGNLGGNPDMGDQLEGMLKLFTAGQGVNGLDTTKPWGVTVQTDDVQFEPIVCLPVKDIKTLLASLAPVIGEPGDEGNGIYSLQAGPAPMFAKAKGGWAFLAQTTDALEHAPADPGKLLANLSKSYDVAVRLNVQNVPEFWRSMAVDQIKAGMEQSTVQEEDESDEAFAERKKLLEMQVEQLVTQINDTRDLTVGWKIDRDARNSHIDIAVTAVPGSKMAAQLANVQEMPTQFSGFIADDAAMSFNFVGKIASEDAEQSIVQIDSAVKAIVGQAEEKIEDEETRQAVKGVIADLVDSVKGTIRAGKMDGGASVYLGDKQMTLVAGVLVADPKKVESSVKKAVALAQKKDPNFTGMKYDAAKHKSIRFHTMTVPVPEGDDLSKVLGDKLDIALGFGSKHVYVAVGTDNLSKVNTAIDGSITGLNKPFPPGRLTLSLGKILKFASNMSGDPMVGMMADELGTTPDKDRLIVAIRPQEGGAVAYRITAEEGVLKLLGKAGQIAQGAGGLPGGPPGLN